MDFDNVKVHVLDSSLLWKQAKEKIRSSSDKNGGKQKRSRRLCRLLVYAQ